VKRNVLTAIVLAAAVVALAAYLASGVRVLDDPEDLRAFYCAGETVAAHRDPYLTEPLRACEVREARAAGLTPYARLALPAPLPGFAFAPLALVARLPFATVSALWVLLLPAALALTALLVHKLADVPVSGIVAALVLGDGWISLANGHIVPFAVLALCASAFEIARDRPVRASIYALLASIEPHVALPACLALAVAAPKTRLPLAAGAALLAAVSLVTIGPGANLEYVLRVLPAHAHSELAAARQFSLTTLLYRSGVSAQPAILLGNVSYALLCVLGIVVARRLARSLAAPELLVLVPPAFAVFGGPFVHLTQVAVAIPALVVLMVRLSAHRTALGIALLLVALPWEDLSENATVAMLVFIGVFSLAIALLVWRASPRVALVAMAGMLAIGGLERTAVITLERPPGDATAALAAVDTSGSQLAETTWAAFVAASQDEDERLYLVTHLPTWFGLGLAIAATVNAARSRAQARESR